MTVSARVRARPAWSSANAAGAAMRIAAPRIVALASRIVLLARRDAPADAVAGGDESHLALVLRDGHHLEARVTGRCGPSTTSTVRAATHSRRSTLRTVSARTRTRSQALAHLHALDALAHEPGLLALADADAEAPAALDVVAEVEDRSLDGLVDGHAVVLVHGDAAGRVHRGFADLLEADDLVSGDRHEAAVVGSVRGSHDHGRRARVAEVESHGDRAAAVPELQATSTSSACAGAAARRRREGIARAARGRKRMVESPNPVPAGRSRIRENRAVTNTPSRTPAGTAYSARLRLAPSAPGGRPRAPFARAKVRERAQREDTPGTRVSLGP